MRDKAWIIENINAIREVIDFQLNKDQMENVQWKVLRMESLLGLSAETISESKALLSLKQMQVLSTLDKDMSITEKKAHINGACWEEEALHDYADRINSAIRHGLDAIRTIISLYKTELEKNI